MDFFTISSAADWQKALPFLVEMPGMPRDWLVRTSKQWLAGEELAQAIALIGA